MLSGAAPDVFPCLAGPAELFWKYDHATKPAPDVESYIAGQVKDGIYRSADEAIVDVVRRTRQADEERHERLLKALAKGGHSSIVAREGNPLPRVDGRDC